MSRDISKRSFRRRSVRNGDTSECVKFGARRFDENQFGEWPRHRLFISSSHPLLLGEKSHFFSPVHFTTPWFELFACSFHDSLVITLHLRPSKAMAFAGRRIAPLFACSFHDSLVLTLHLRPSKAMAPD